MYDKISSAIDNKKFTDGVFPSKAFDTVNDNIFVEKRHHYGSIHDSIQPFANKCKVIYTLLNPKSHARYITFPVPAHRVTEDSHNTGNFMPYSFQIVCGSLTSHIELINMEGISGT